MVAHRFGHDREVVWCTRDADARKVRPDVRNPAESFPASTRKGRRSRLFGYSIDKCVKSVNIGVGLPLGPKQGEGDAPLFGDPNARPRSGRLAPNKSPTLLEGVESSAQSTVLGLR